MRQSTRLLLQLLIPVALVAAYGLSPPLQHALKRIIFLFSMLDVSAVKGYILSFGFWAPAVSFLLMLFQSVAFPLPAFLITFANAALFGWVMGAALSWVSALAGAILCFYISRFYGRKGAEKLTGKLALDSVDLFFRRHGRYAVLIARLLPFISFDVVSYAAGLTSIGFWDFVWATGLGQLPATLVYSYVGDMLVGNLKTVVLGLLMLFALSILAYLTKKIYTERQKQEHSQKECKRIRKE